MSERYVRPDWFTSHIFNPLVAFLTRRGISVWGSRVLAVRGRASGEWRTTPVNVLVHGDQRYLVAPRGSTSWVRNALANGTVVLKKGRWREEWLVRALSANEKPAVCGAQSLPRSLQARGAALLPGAGGRSRGRVRTARRSVPGLRVVIQAIRTR